jgi:hypothetical protein
VGLLKKGISAFRLRNGQNDAGASDATANVADGRFRVRLRPGSKVGFFNSPTVTYYGAMSRRSMTMIELVERMFDPSTGSGQALHNSCPRPRARTDRSPSSTLRRHRQPD